MKRYHPHGDASIYDTLVHMAQDWAMRHRLIHSQGNFGSIAGLPPQPTGIRKPGCRTSPPRCLQDLDRDTVDYIDNYDGKYREPMVLPSKFPNLLVNGSDGIAVGMATEIPRITYARCATALIKLIDEPETNILQLMEIIPGPDFPRRHHLRRQGIVDGYTTGRGRSPCAPAPTSARRATAARSSSPRCRTSRRATAWLRPSATW